MVFPPLAYPRSATLSELTIPHSVHHHPGRIQLAGEGRIRDHRVGMAEGVEIQPSERASQVGRHVKAHIVTSDSVKQKGCKFKHLVFDRRNLPNTQLASRFVAMDKCCWESIS